MSENTTEPKQKTIFRPSKRQIKRKIAQAYKVRASFVESHEIGEVVEAAIAARSAMRSIEIIPKKPSPLEKAPDTIVVHKVARAIAAGLTRQLAAGSAGITPGVIDKWIRNGESGEGPFAEAYRIVMAAEAEAALAMLEVVGGAATGSAGFDKDTQDWKAAAWVLERRFPHQYGRTVQETEHAVRAETEEDKVLLDKLLGKT